MKWLKHNIDIFGALFYASAAVQLFADSKEVRRVFFFACFVWCAQRFFHDWLRKRWPDTWK